MTPKLWTFATVALLVGIAIIVGTVYDVTAMIKGWPTITEVTGIETKSHPIFPAMFGLVVGLVVGTFFGHLFWSKARSD